MPQFKHDFLWDCQLQCEPKKRHIIYLHKQLHIPNVVNQGKLYINDGIEIKIHAVEFDSIFAEDGDIKMFKWWQKSNRQYMV